MVLFQHLTKIRENKLFPVFLFIILTLLLLKPYSLLGRGFKFKPGMEKSIIPFLYMDGLIILPFKIENKKVDLILDTGISNIVLFDRSGTYGLKPEPEKTILFSGIGTGNFIKGNLVTEVRVEAENIEGSGLAIVIIPQNSIIKNSRININGMIGYDLFSKFLVTIDYKNKQIILSSPKDFTTIDSYIPKDLIFLGTKPFVNFILSVPGVEDKVYSLFIDTGAGFDLLLNNSPFSYQKKEKNKTFLGNGLTGKVRGKIYLIHDISIENFYFQNLLLSIPASGTYKDKSLMKYRDGTLGGKFLYKFNKVVLDYSNNKIYFLKESLLANE